MSALTQALVDVGFNVRRAEAIEAALLTSNGITNAQLADMAQATIKGRANGAGTGDPTDLSGDQVITIITQAGAGGVSASGNRWGVIPFVAGDGVMEVGRHLDFHNSDGDTSDNAVRLETNGGTTGLFETPSGGSLKRIASAINSTLAQGDVLYYDGTNFVRLGPGTSGQFLQTQGAGANPQWATPASVSLFTSAQQTITSAGSLTIAHGLGAKPNLVDGVAQCTTAENGYSVGDEIALSIFGARIAVVPDATNLNVRYSNLNPALVAPNFTTGVSVGLTNANWSLVLRAWKF